MERRTKRLGFFSLIVALAALPVAAQIPTSNLSGHVTAGKVVLPGVTLSATSPALQGTRVAVTSSSGDYVFPFLPPGEYTVAFELEGFRTVSATVRLSAAQTSRLDAELTAQFSDEIAVTGSQETISTSTTAATTYGHDLIEQLPVPRDLYNAVALAPGVHTSGYAGGRISISGAEVNESLFLINGVVVNENYVGQPTPLFIEDAIQETTTSVSGISAEYGRFAGGVVNMLTKSGGNDLHGSLRANLDSEKWTATTPLTAAERSDAINTTYEATLGGFLWKDHVWFFGAGRDFTLTGSNQTAVTDIPYPIRYTETRYEGKLTISPTPNHRVVASYLDRTQSWANVSFSPLPFVDAGDSIFDTSILGMLEAAHYTGVLSDSFFLEGQWSQRTEARPDYGSRFHDDPLQGGYQGTVVYDNTNGYTGNAAVFCGVCEPETRDNKDVLAKASWFLSTGSTGSHEIVLGVDRFQDLVFTMNHQSGSDWWFSATEFGFDGQDWWPVVYGDGSADLDWFPVLEASKGINLTTDSAFLNDTWRLSDQLSFNLGLRWDANDGVNATGAQVSKDSRLSPRLGVTYSPGGEGDWVLNASYAHYVTSLASLVAKHSSPGGSPATFIWLYGGPDINTGAGPYLTPQQVLEQVFTWFTNDYCDAAGNCGIANFDLLAIVDIPGYTQAINGSLESPYAEEIAFGAARRLGTRGLLRIDFTHREFKDLYENRVDMGTGQVELEALGVDWGSVDLGTIQNSSYSRRAYDGISLQGDYRVGDRLHLGGNYTWSHAYGNFDAASGYQRSVRVVQHPLLLPRVPRRQLVEPERRTRNGPAPPGAPVGGVGPALHPPQPSQRLDPTELRLGDTVLRRRRGLLPPLRRQPRLRQPSLQRALLLLGARRLHHAGDLSHRPLPQLLLRRQGPGRRPRDLRPARGHQCVQPGAADLGEHHRARRHLLLRHIRQLQPVDHGTARVPPGRRRGRVQEHGRELAEGPRLRQADDPRPVPDPAHLPHLGWRPLLAGTSHLFPLPRASLGARQTRLRLPVRNYRPAGEGTDLDLPAGVGGRVAHHAQVGQRAQLRQQLVVRQRVQWRPGEVRHRPQPDRRVVAAGGDPAPVGRHRDARDRAGVAVEQVGFVTGERAGSHNAILVPSHQHRAAGVDGERPKPVAVRRDLARRVRGEVEHRERGGFSVRGPCKEAQHQPGVGACEQPHFTRG